jgi:hypothetical protein
MAARPKNLSLLLLNFLSAVIQSLKKNSLKAGGISFFFCFFLFLSFSSSPAQTDLSAIPPEFGEVIYQYNQRSPAQLFIIGMAHRDSLTGLSIPNIARVQAEVYKLGQWLIQNEQCQLLLPEGFFAAPAGKTGRILGRAADEKLICPESIDLKTLEEKLSDNRSFINAELLLKRNYSLRLRQVEDENFYRAAGECIRELVNSGEDQAEYLRIKSQLDYLQEKRTAAMLQKIPEIIQAEFRQGNIKAPKAIFTIGLSHLPSIIGYLQENRVRIYSPLPGMEQKEVYTADLNLKKENFGVSIFLPQTLAGDRQALKITGLDQIIAAHRRHSSARSPSFPRN